MPQQEDAYWSRDPSALLGELHANARGLSETEAADRLARYGPNAVEEHQDVAALRLLLRQFARSF